MGRKSEWFRLSWSKFDTYRKCPQKYNWKYVERRDSPMRESKHFAVVGSVVQRVFEYYYDYQVYKRNHRAIDILLDKTEEFFQEYLDDNYVNFNHVTCPYDRGEALDLCRDCVEKTQIAIDREGLVGYKNFAEAAIQMPFMRSRLGKTSLFGRLDFLIQKGDKSDPQNWILDGKSTKKRDRVDPDQLYFYALMFALRYEMVPDRLGFLFFRFGDDPDKALKWLDVSVERLYDMKMEAADVVESIKADTDWKPTPEPSYCRYCPFEKVCDARQEQKDQNRRSRMDEDAKAADDFFKDSFEGGSFTLSELKNE